MIVNTLRDFARITVESGDLDPMYDLIHHSKSEKGRDWTHRFCLHFFMFYDAGGAAYAAGATHATFWDYVKERKNEFRRGTERRHFRAKNSDRAIEVMSQIGDPADVWKQMYATYYKGMVDNVQTHFKGCQIGPYFIWKAMDLLDRGMGYSVQLKLEDAIKYMPDQPRDCAKYLWPDRPLAEVLDEVVSYISDLPAPGVPNRYCSYAEAETILCMAKGYFITKSHTIGDDVDEKHYQLSNFPELCDLLPPKQDWSKYTRGSLII